MIKSPKIKKDFEDFLYNTISRYSQILLLDKHTFQVKYAEDLKGSLFECVYNYPYLNVVINYSDEVVKRWQEGKFLEVSNYIIHELCHPITDPLYAKATSRFISRGEIEDERERLTDYIAQIIIKNNFN